MSAVHHAIPSTDLRIVRITEQSTGLEIAWSDNHQSFFHNIWLRDCCYCEHCGDSYSSKRYIVPSDIALDSAPAWAKIQDDGSLAICWKSEDHLSSYDAGWLRQNCYDETSRELRRHKPTLWNSDLNASLPEIAFDDAVAKDSSRLDAYRHLRDFGFVILRDGPARPGSIKQVAAMFGEIGESSYSKIFDLSPKSKTRTIGNSSRPVPPHTDEAFRFTPPGVNILSCVCPASDGGDTILTDGFNLANRMRLEDPESFTLLTRHGHRFHRLHPGKLDQQANLRMIALDDRGEVCGVRIHTRASGPMDLPVELIEPFYKAHHKLSTLMMAPENQARLRLNAGDTAVFDNHRVLHARTDFTDLDRHMQICNTSREEFHEHLRILASKLNFQAESLQILTAGMAF